MGVPAPPRLRLTTQNRSTRQAGTKVEEGRPSRRRTWSNVRASARENRARVWFLPKSHASHLHAPSSPVPRGPIARRGFNRSPVTAEVPHHRRRTRGWAAGPALSRRSDITTTLSGPSQTACSGPWQKVSSTTRLTHERLLSRILDCAMRFAVQLMARQSGGEFLPRLSRRMSLGSFPMPVRLLIGSPTSHRNRPNSTCERLP